MANTTASDIDTTAPIISASSETMESKIASALNSRKDFLLEKADSLTMYKVWRLLETDLGLERFALDDYKLFMKQQVFKVLGINGDGAIDCLKTEPDDNDGSVVEGLKANSVNGDQLKKDLKESGLAKDNSADNSPKIGLVSGNEKTEQGIKDAKCDEDTNESVAETALLKIEDYFRAILDNTTMAGVRRRFEEDLKHERYPFKKFITRELAEIIKPPPVSTSKMIKKTSSKDIVSKKASRPVSREGSESSDGKSMNLAEEEDASSRKRTASDAKPDKKQPLKKSKKGKLATNGDQIDDDGEYSDSDDNDDLKDEPEKNDDLKDNR